MKPSGLSLKLNSWNSHSLRANRSIQPFHVLTRLRSLCPTSIDTSLWKYLMAYVYLQYKELTRPFIHQHDFMHHHGRYTLQYVEALMISELAAIDRKLQSWSRLNQSRGSEGCIPQRSSQGRICKDLPAPWSWHEQIVDLAHHLWLAFAMTLVCTSFWVLHGAHFCTFDWMLFLWLGDYGERQHTTRAWTQWISGASSSTSKNVGSSHRVWAPAIARDSIPCGNSGVFDLLKHLALSALASLSDCR